MHGKTSQIAHDGSGIFEGVPSPLKVARYHSLVIDPPSCRRRFASWRAHSTTARSWRWCTANIRVVGVQFHPESAATHHGYALIERFLRGAAARMRGCRHVPTVPPATWAGRCGASPTTSGRRSCRLRSSTSADRMIVESIVTTVAADGAVNCAPMGVEWG
jgi:hypothetical protein